MPDFTGQVQSFFKTAKVEKPPEPVHVLQSIAFVCTGNICRSAFAQYALEVELQQLDPGPRPFSVNSAGLGALPGAPMEPQMAAEFLSMYGMFPSHHARQIDDVFVANAGLLLVMTRVQRHEVLHRYPQGAQRCFLLSEFLAILASAHVSPGRLGFSALVSYAHSHRAMAHDDFPDITDPFRRSPEMHRRAARQLAVAVRELEKWLTVYRKGSWPIAAISCP